MNLSRKSNDNSKHCILEPTIPFTLCLQLSGKPKTVQWRRAGVIDGSAKTTNGIYNVGSKDVNGYPHWVHENNKQAIWFNKISKSWFIGDIEDLGENAAGISGAHLFESYQQFLCNLSICYVYRPQR